MNPLAYYEGYADISAKRVSNVRQWKQTFFFDKDDKDKKQEHAVVERETRIMRSPGGTDFLVRVSRLRHNMKRVK